MKIAFVYDPIYPYVIGGAEKRYRQFAEMLAKRGHDVHLIGMKYWQGENIKIENGVNLIGICKAVPLYGKNGSRSVFEAVYFGCNVFIHLTRNSYDIVDCCSFPYFSAIACRLAMFMSRGKVYGKLVVTWLEVWGQQYWKKYSGFLWFAGYLTEKIVSRLTVHNISISSFTAEQMSMVLDMEKSCISIIPCGIDYGHLCYQSSAVKESRIIYVGRIIEHKKVDLLIEAFKDLLAEGFLPREYKGLKLQIIGRGPDEAKCRKLAQKLGIAGSVEFSGIVEEEDVQSAISRSMIFVLPSEREGLGISVVESMALGTPVAARNAELSAVKGIIKNGVSGILFDDKMGLKDAVIRLLSDEPLYKTMVREGRKTSSEYDIQAKITPKLENYYKTRF